MDKKYKSMLKKTWNFIWNDDSLLSWIVNIIIAFVLVKFIIYPGLGLVFGTNYPVVAVVSGSMEHNGNGFDSWWALNNDLYNKLGISKEEFSNYRFVNGFNKGDLMVIFGVKDIKKGDVIVFFGSGGEPIIHRVVIAEDKGNGFYIQTKGDNNKGSRNDESGIINDRIIGVAKYRIPYLGWFKLVFLMLFGGTNQ